MYKVENIAATHQY